MQEIVISGAELAENIRARRVAALECNHVTSIGLEQPSKLIAFALRAGQIPRGILDDKHAQGCVRRKDRAPFCASPIGDPIETTHADVQRGATILEVEGLPRNGRASL